MTAPGTLAWASWEEPSPKPGQAVIEVAGCGVCHTDLSFLYGGVPTRKAAPIVLGHEIAGVVVEVGEGAESWLGRRVIAPAVAPCGACAHCKGGRATSCKSGLMPGNDHDGGFARYVTVPARPLCDVDFGGKPGTKDEPLPGGLKLAELSVLADAVTTPLQAQQRAGLQAGMLAVFVGVGGVGGFGVQLAKAKGAHVVAIDVDAAKLERAQKYGASAVIDAKAGVKEVRAALRDAAKKLGAPADGWRIFETSGTTKGQELAFSLLSHAGVLSIVGFTPEPVNVRLSNLMALDATAHGNWGSDPAIYPEAVQLCLSGAVQVRPFVKESRLADGIALLEAAHHHGSLERPILVP